MPRMSTKAVERALADPVAVEARARILKSTGNAREALQSAGEIEAPPDVIDQDWADTMAFNEELVKVIVLESTEKFAEQIVEVGVNGVMQRFIRGEEQTVKRKYLEQLARAKMTTYTQQKIKDGEDNESYRNVPHTALRYPFTVTEDQNPRGADWLRMVKASQ